jgi:lipid A ethanolaminephosphotransferase
MSLRMTYAPWRVGLLVAIFIVLANNSRFFGSLLQSLEMSVPHDFMFMVLIVALMIFVVVTLLLTFGVGRLFKPVVILMLLLSATLSYFANELGVVFDKHMFVNIADTILERNLPEAQELASWPLALHVLLYGVLPSCLVAAIRIEPKSFFIGLRNRGAVVALGAIVVGTLLLGNYRFATFFAVEHRDLQYAATPVYPLISLVRAVDDAMESPPEFRTLDSNVQHDQQTTKRTVGIMLVGETARADHFSMDGYRRITNPVMSEVPNLMFLEADSCGTSTAFSVPCMFFMRGHENYSPEIARTESNVLDILATAGIDVNWVDNNSSCKHVCDRVPNVNLRLGPDGTVQHTDILDIELVDVAEHYIHSSTGDMLIVLHMMGSHGPAYSERYPEGFARFTPYCHKASPSECSADEVSNAYDNTILYTDYVVGALIETLRAHPEFDSFLFYASDHGESLGENGVYLHGLPRLVAPSSQTVVPMVLWLSPEYAADTSSRPRSVFTERMVRPSHDNIPHTLLGLFGVHGRSYDPDYDLVAHDSTSSIRASTAPDDADTGCAGCRPTGPENAADTR